MRMLVNHNQAPGRKLLATAVLGAAMAALLCGSVNATATALGSNATKLPRLHDSNLHYLGAFLLPPQVNDTDTFSYGGTALAYNPQRQSLFVVGHDWYQLTAEVSAPAPVKSTRLSGLPTARFLQPFTDATDGAIDQAGSSTNKIGGELVYKGRLYGTVYVYYDATDSQVVSHWVRSSTSLTAGTVKGLYQVGSQGAGFVSGFMALVPKPWRHLLGGPVLTGNCCIPIISRTSFGPDAFAFDPVNLGKRQPAPDVSLLYYPQEHPTIGAWNASWKPKKGIYFGGGTSIKGMVFPRGSRTVLYFGTQGVGKFCYGEGTDNPNLAGKPTPDGTIWCYDPDNSSKGTHAYPYQPEVWAYDAKDLLAVRQGRRKPWQVKPYAVWKLKLPFGSNSIGGAAYDPSTNRIFVSQQYANGTDPVIHVFRVKP